jgi:carboxymethylenebutenolidase
MIPINGHLVIPKSGTGGGVLILHSWWGLNSFFKNLCQRFADAGFVALAADLYSGKVATTISESKQRTIDFTKKTLKLAKNSKGCRQTE